MKKLLTVLGGAMFFFAFTFTANAQGSFNGEVSPTEGALTFTEQETFQLTVSVPTEVEENTLESLEVDHSYGKNGSITKCTTGDARSYYPDGDCLPEFSVYPNSEKPWGDDDSAVWAESLGISLSYNDGRWVFDFGNDLTTHFAETLGGITFYFVSHYDVNTSFGSMDLTTPENTFEYSFDVTPNSLEVSLQDRTIREGQTASFEGGIKLNGYVGDIVNGDSNTHWAVDYTISTDASLDGVTITTKDEGGNDVDITAAFVASDKGLESKGHVINAEEGDDFMIPLDFKVTAQNRGTYEFTISSTATRGEEKLEAEKTYTLTVNRRSSGGGGSAPRVDRDERDAEDEEDAEDGADESGESTDEATDIISDITSELADLMEQVANYNDLSDEERANLAVRLAEMMTRLQEQLREVSGASDHDFTRDLTVGSVGEDVRALQIFLNANGFTVAESGAGSAGSETNYFGELTRQALARYQAANGISPAAGYFGAITRAHIEG